MGTRLPRLPAAGLLALGALETCPVCQASPAGLSGVCEPCRAWLEAAVAAAPAPVGTRCWLGPYAGPWERLIAALKHRGAHRLGAYLGALVAVRVRAWGFEPDLVTWVPASPRRRTERGFDQAEELASAVAEGLRRPCVATLARSPASRSQKRLSRASRAVNAASAFTGLGTARGRVLLVDDVLTTGATADACADALEAAGASEVRVAVVARTVRGAARPPSPW